jgi:hypothetical protein
MRRSFSTSLVLNDDEAELNKEVLLCPTLYIDIDPQDETLVLEREQSNTLTLSQSYIPETLFLPQF